MKIINEATELVALDKLKPHPKNPRQGDVGAIHVSIEANGFYGSVIAQKSTGHIIAGNHRYLAAKHANAEAIPVTWVDVSDEEAVRILLADNRTNDLATYNDDALAELLQDLMRETGSIDGTGFDGDDLDELLKDLSDVNPTDFPELPTEDREPFQRVTLTLHDDQVARLEKAITFARKSKTLERAYRFTRWFREQGVTAKQVNEATNTFMGSHYISVKTQPAIPTQEMWERMKHLVTDVPGWVLEDISREDADKGLSNENARGNAVFDICEFYLEKNNDGEIT